MRTTYSSGHPWQAYANHQRGNKLVEQELPARQPMRCAVGRGSPARPNLRSRWWWGGLLTLLAVDRPVAYLVLRTAVHAAVMVVMPKIPVIARPDQPTTPPADNVAGFHQWLPRRA
jgi:hypothetical protein